MSKEVLYKLQPIELADDDEMEHLSLSQMVLVT